MNTKAKSHSILFVVCISCTGFLLALLLWPLELSAQSPIRYTANAVEYGIRSDVRVNPTTLALEFHMTLATYPGRNDSQLPIAVSYSSKQWSVEYRDYVPGDKAHRIQAWYAAHWPLAWNVGAWTSSLNRPVIRLPQDTSYQTYDCWGQPSRQYTTPCQFLYQVKRARVFMPDGSAHELRKDDIPCASGCDFNGTYYAVDGSRLRYETNSQMLYLPDGSRYWFGAPGGSQYIDRNGNTLSFNGTTNQWTDTLGRVFAVPPVGQNQPLTPGDYVYNLPGVNGSSIPFIFKWRLLSDPGVLTDPSQELRYIGDSYPPRFPSLFGGTTSGFRFMSGSERFNPMVLWQIEWPNHLAYTFTYNVYGEIDKITHPNGGYERFVHDQVDGLNYIFSDRDAYRQVNRGVIEHRVSADGVNEEVWRCQGVHSGKLVTPSYYTVTITRPDGSSSERRLHAAGGSLDPFDLSDVRLGRAFDERVYSPTGQMLRRTLTRWDVTESRPTIGSVFDWPVTRDPRVAREVTLLLDTGDTNALAASKLFSYDGDNNRTWTYDYQYVTVSQTTAQSGSIDTIPLGSL